MSFARTCRHLAATGWSLRRAFTPQVLDAVESAVHETESSHGGEVRFAIESNLNFAELWRQVTPRERAIEVFAHLGVWDTENNNGVLIYVLWTDHDVEIVADRAFKTRVMESEWRDICRRMEQLFAANQPQQAAVEGVRAVGQVIARHFPATDRNELPNRPVML
jgi:TPM domain